jgi:hypothetical protein
MRSRLLLACCATVLLGLGLGLGLGPGRAGAQRASSAGSASVVGYVTSRGGGEPLAFADASIDQFDIATLATREGTFRLRGIPAGTVTLLVRRLGFTPAVVRLTLVAGRQDTVRVQLEPLALQLERIRVTDAVCAERESAGADTATLALLNQLRDNADRNKLLAHESPFVTYMERTIGDADVSRSGSGLQLVNVMRVDTVPVPGEHEWRYEPGKLVAPTAADENAAREKMIVPQLVDFADDAFMDNHCFRYGGLSNIDGSLRIRLDFEPIKGLHTPDVRGSMYLDTASYALTRTTLLADVPSPIRPTEETWEVTVDTWFREILPALPIIDRICTRTLVRSNTRSTRPSRAAVETQRLVDFRFERESAVSAGLLSVKAATRVECR